MLKKTKNYEMFKFREDNRAKIDQAHIKNLTHSIKTKNLLELRPIIVNQEFEVLDGQHRLLAAKALGVEIYYTVENQLKSQDIILMNVSKAWGLNDYFNYYLKNGYDEYSKLADFMKTNNISLKIAMNITLGTGKEGITNFKEGKYKFSEDVTNKTFEICWDTIGFIKKMNGYSIYTETARFWKALLKLVNHAYFEEEKWKYNLPRMVDRFGPRAREEDYLKLMMDSYNWRNTVKVNLFDDVEK